MSLSISDILILIAVLTLLEGMHRAILNNTSGLADLIRSFYPMCRWVAVVFLVVALCDVVVGDDDVLLQRRCY